MAKRGSDWVALVISEKFVNRYRPDRYDKGWDKGVGKGGARKGPEDTGSRGTGGPGDGRGWATAEHRPMGQMKGGHQADYSNMAFSDIPIHGLEAGNGKGAGVGTLPHQAPMAQHSSGAGQPMQADITQAVAAVVQHRQTGQAPVAMEVETQADAAPAAAAMSQHQHPVAAVQPMQANITQATGTGAVRMQQHPSEAGVHANSATRRAETGWGYRALGRGWPFEVGSGLTSDIWPQYCRTPDHQYHGGSAPTGGSTG